MTSITLSGDEWLPCGVVGILRLMGLVAQRRHLKYSMNIINYKIFKNAYRILPMELGQLGLELNRVISVTIQPAARLTGIGVSSGSGILVLRSSSVGSGLFVWILTLGNLKTKCWSVLYLHIRSRWQLLVRHLLHILHQRELVRFRQRCLKCEWWLTVIQSIQ